MRRRLLVVFALGLLGCAAEAPAARPERPAETDLARDVKRFLDRPGASTREIDISVEEADLAEVMAEIGSKAGRTIRVSPDVHERVTISLRKIPWRDAVDVIAKMTKCEVVERDGELVLDQPSFVNLQVDDADIRVVLELLAAYAGERCWVGADATGTASFNFQECGVDQGRALARTFGVVTQHYGLSLARVGAVFVVGTAPIVTVASTGPVSTATRATAHGTPAAEWFQLLGATLGVKIDGTGSLRGWVQGTLAGTSIEDVLHASAAANGFTLTATPTGFEVAGGRECPPRVEEVSELELPDGRTLALVLHAVVFRPPRGPSRALISGHVFVEGDPLRDARGEIVPGVTVGEIEPDAVRLSTLLGEAVLRRP